MSNIEPRWVLKDLGNLSDGLTSAGIGVEAIGRLLNESELSADDTNGLQQAIMALGDYVRRVGYEIHEASGKLSGGAK